MTRDGVLERIFDAAFYIGTYADVPGDPEAAFEHYVTVGARLRRTPNRLLDPGFYAERYPDIGDVDPVEHYLNHGEREGRQPHILFDPGYYIAQAPAARARPLLHFLTRGGARGLDPHPLFESKRYRRDLEPGSIPLVHYLAGGWRHSAKTHALFDQPRYLERYPDVLRAAVEPIEHYLRSGEREFREPSEFFDARYYFERYDDVRQSGQSALLHFISDGYREGRDPSANFTTSFYRAHNLAGNEELNPLVHYADTGRAERLPTNPLMRFEDFEPSRVSESARRPADLGVDVIVPIYGGIFQTQRCVESVLAAGLPPYARLVLIDDASPEPRIANYVASFAGNPGIVVLANENNLGFVATVNRGMRIGAGRDAILLNSDTEVANDWIERLVRVAHAAPDIATVTPFTNNGTIASFPTMPHANPIPKGLSVDDVDRLVAITNRGRTVDVPTAVGFAMYIRRDALDDVGPFDEATFGRGYGEENDFCLRATAHGWRHVLATGIFVYHAGGVSFSSEAELRKETAMAILRSLYPSYESEVAAHVSRDDGYPFRIGPCLTALRESPLPTLLFITHALGGGVKQHVAELVQTLAGKANVLQLAPGPYGCVRLETLEAPFPFSFTLHPERQYAELLALLRTTGVDRVHVHHVIDLPLDAERLIADLGVPFDFTVHDFYTVCPQINLVDAAGSYCGQPGEIGCDACIRIRPNAAHLDIASWRAKHAWLLVGAERVITPSRDTAARLAEYYRGARFVPVSHPNVRSIDFETRAPAVFA